MFKFWERENRSAGSEATRAVSGPLKLRKGGSEGSGKKSFCSCSLPDRNDVWARGSRRKRGDVKFLKISTIRRFELVEFLRYYTGNSVEVRG